MSIKEVREGKIVTRKREITQKIIDKENNLLETLTQRRHSKINVDFTQNTSGLIAVRSAPEIFQEKIKKRKCAPLQLLKLDGTDIKEK